MIKLIAVDMDGTVLDDSHVKALPETIAAIKKAKEAGITTVIATGRPLLEAKIPFLENLELFDYYICNNGTYFWDSKKDKFTFEKSLTKEVAKVTAKLAEENNSFFTLHTQRNVYKVKTEGIDLNAPEWQEMKRFKLTTMEQALSARGAITQVSIRTTKEKAINIKEKLLAFSNDISVTIANDVYVDVNPKGITKFEGLHNLGAMIDIDPEEMMAFGDSGNDVEMLKNVGIGIAMGNATEEAKKVADEVIGDNTTTAIAERINKVL